MEQNQIGTSKNLSISILKDKLIEMRQVYEHVFSSRIYLDKTNNSELDEWLLEISCRMRDVENTISELENQ